MFCSARFMNRIIYQPFTESLSTYKNNHNFWYDGKSFP